MRLLSITGNRPQFIKSGPLALALREHPQVELLSLHTGQHYDHGLSGVFFDELGLPEPTLRLEPGSGSHAETTARILVGVEAAVRDLGPDGVIVYGDTNSTLAGALAAAKLHVPVAHVEAGLRSFDRRMPEELNRVLTDRLSSLLLCPSERAVANLRLEGMDEGVHVVGDVMLDVVRRLAPLAAERSPYPEALGLSPDGYLLATVHRESNTEEPSLGRLVEGLTALEEPVVVPAHPRLRAALEREGLLDRLAAGAIIVEPLGLLDLTALLQGARLCLTDSGGLQKEAYLHRVPCVTLRDTSEWVETVELGWNVLVGDDPEALAEAVATLAPPERHPPLYGDGNAAPAAAERLADPAWLTAGGARAHG